MTSSQNKSAGESLRTDSQNIFEQGKINVYNGIDTEIATPIDRGKDNEMEETSSSVEMRDNASVQEQRNEKDDGKNESFIHMERYYGIKNASSPVESVEVPKYNGTENSSSVDADDYYERIVSLKAIPRGEAEGSVSNEVAVGFISCFSLSFIVWILRRFKHELRSRGNNSSRQFVGDVVDPSNFEHIHPPQASIEAQIPKEELCDPSVFEHVEPYGRRESRKHTRKRSPQFLRHKSPG